MADHLVLLARALVTSYGAIVGEKQSLLEIEGVGVIHGVSNGPSSGTAPLTAQVVSVNAAWNQSVVVVVQVEVPTELQLPQIAHAGNALRLLFGLGQSGQQH